MSPSSGSTSAGRAATLLALSALLLAAASPPPARGASCQTCLLSLGFGPSSLTNTSEGVPIYTVGESVWAESGYPTPVNVSLTWQGGVPSKVIASSTLAPGVVAPLYTFAPSDPDGVWNITVSGSVQSFSVPVRFVNLASHQASLGPLFFSLDSGNLSIAAKVNPGDSYDQEVCATGGESAGVVLGLPTAMHDLGTLTVVPGASLSVSTLGLVNESTSFWLELYQPYGLQVGSADSVVTTDILAASSSPVAIVSNSNATAPLNWNAPVREGRYDLRAYFQNSTSLLVEEAGVLVLGATSWISLSGSCVPVALASGTMTYSSSLTGSETDWPRTLYLMYRTQGVEAVASYPVDANISSVTFVASPWNEPILGAKVSVSPADGIIQTSQSGSSLFVLAADYPASLSYSLDIAGGSTLAQGSLSFNASYQSQTDEVPTAMLTVHVVGNQGSPTTISVTGPGGLNLTSSAVGTNPSESLFLPEGPYTVSASQGGGSQSATVGLSQGDAIGLTLNLNSASDLEVILVVTAVIAAVANFMVWMGRPRGLGRRPAPSD